MALQVASQPRSRLSPQDVKSPRQQHGDVLTAISDGMVALLKEFYGRGPTRTKSYYEDDLVVSCCAAASIVMSARSESAGSMT